MGAGGWRRSRSGVRAPSDGARGCHAIGERSAVGGLGRIREVGAAEPTFPASLKFGERFPRYRSSSASARRVERHFLAIIRADAMQERLYFASAALLLCAVHAGSAPRLLALSL